MNIQMKMTKNNLVAIIDNDAEFIKRVRDYLTSEGFEVIVASNGLELISILRIDRPAAILINVMLPWIDSIEMLMAIKGNPNFRDIRVFLISNEEWEKKNSIEKGDTALISGIFYKHLEKSNFIAKLKEEIEKNGSH